jgi:hypothetical protein
MSKTTQPLIQLPNDIQAHSYKQTAPFQWEQVYSSASKRFIGTEREFLAAGHAYAYVQVDQFTRRVVCPA